MKMTYNYCKSSKRSSLTVSQELPKVDIQNLREAKGRVDPIKLIKLQKVQRHRKVIDHLNRRNQSPNQVKI